MGKLKQALIIEEEEEQMAKRGKGLNICGIDISDEELATVDREFHEWLDNYEKSFGVQGESHD